LNVSFSSYQFNSLPDIAWLPVTQFYVKQLESMPSSVHSSSFLHFIMNFTAQRILPL